MSLPKPDDRRLAAAACVLWTIYVLVIAIVAYRQYRVDDAAGAEASATRNRGAQPVHTVTDNYRKPSLLWWQGKNIYPEPVTSSGFLYLPQAALLFTPFTWLPARPAEALWRVIGGMVLLLAIYRLVRVGAGKAWPAAFLLVVAMCMAPGAGAMRNGQMNILLGALMIHAALDLAKQRWARATFLLILALALKPLAIVLILLVAAIYPRRMSWRLAVGVLVMLMLPFVAQPNVYPFNPDFVLKQYELCVRTMLTAGDIAPQSYPDVAGMLHAFGLPVAPTPMLLTRVAAAGVTLGLAWLARRRWGRAWGAIMVVTFAATYLMLFNPRTEGNGYIILAPMVALLAAVMLMLERRPIAGWALMVMLVGLGFSGKITGGPNVWLRPVMTCVFAIYISYLAVAGRPPVLSGEISD